MKTMVSSKSNRVRPAEVAAETKKSFIPTVKSQYANLYPPYSILYQAPTEQLQITRCIPSIQPPEFYVEIGDPASRAIELAHEQQCGSGGLADPELRLPLICAANERRPGGDWETGASGYEETLCRRSNLAATLNSPRPDLPKVAHYPIPSTGGILSSSVVLWRGPPDDYQTLPELQDLPVVSVPPTRWPKLNITRGELRYSFSQEQEMIRQKMEGALRICLYNGYRSVVIGDFGLGNSYRNPPHLMAEMWRELFLFNPDIRGQFQQVYFIFEDPTQSTISFIHDEMARKAGRSSHKASHKSRGSSGSSSSAASGHSSETSEQPTDVSIFEYVFHPQIVHEVFSTPDDRYSLQNLLG